MSYSFPTDAKDGDKIQLDNGIEYIYQEDKERWVVNSSKDGLSGHFVKRQGGDSMEGPLTILAQDSADGRATKRVETLGVFSNSDGSALRLGTTRDRVYVGHNDTSFNGPIKVGEVQEKNAGTGIEFANRVILKTEGAEDDEAVTKKYIDDMARHLQDEIVELEEEIDAIAPSVERGRWSFTAVGTVAQPGQFTMYDADFGNGSPTGLFKSARSIWFNELDLDGTPHSFANVRDGELLEIFIDGSPEYGLFSVTGEAHDETATGSKFWVIDVDFVRTNETTTAIGPGEICRFKIFEAPSGGDATSFVMKSGDTMSGNLIIDKSDESTDTEAGLTLTGNRPSTADSAATITFDNEQSTAKGYLTYRSYGSSSYFKFNRDLDLNNNGLHSVGQIRMEPSGGIGAGNNTRLTFHNASSGQEGEGLLVVPRPVDNRRGFAIRGNNADGDEQDILYSFTNTGKADAINYLGKMDSGKNLVNKAYVDAQMSELMKKIEELEMSSASEVGRNLNAIVLADTRTSVSYGYVGPVESNSQSITISIPGVSIAPRGQITLREDGANALGERFTFNILEAAEVGRDNMGARWEVKVVLDGSTERQTDYSLRTGGRRTEVGLLNGAWAQEPVSGAVHFKVYSGDIVESGTVTDPLKVYALDDYGDLETDEDRYAYGLFIPLEYLNTIAKYETFGDIEGHMMRVYGTTEYSTGHFQSIASIPKERIEDAEYNGTKGIKLWNFSRFSATTRIDVNMYNVLITRAPDRDHELSDYSAGEADVADALPDDES